MAEKTDQEIIEELGLENENNKQDNTQEESLQAVDNDDNLSLNNNEEPSQEENTIVNEDLDEKPLQKKRPKIFKYLIFIIAALSIILTIGTVLYLTGFFEEEKKQEQMVKVEPIKIKEEPDIDIEDLDQNKLNKKLKMLTKTEILDKEELEAQEQKIKEEKRKEEEAKQKAIEEQRQKEEQRLAKEKEALQKEKELLEQRQQAIKKEQEEFLKLQEQIKKEFEEKRKELQLGSSNNNNTNNQSKNENMVVEQIINKTIEANNSNTNNEQKIQRVEDETISNELFLSFINVAIIKGNLKKEYLDKIQSIDKKVSLCRDSKNRIEIYFGPYDSSTQRNKIFDILIENGFKDAFLVDFTKEEYEKRCNY